MRSLAAGLAVTVTALVVGYVAEPYLGRGLADLLGGTGLNRATSVSVSIQTPGGPLRYVVQARAL